MSKFSNIFSTLFLTSLLTCNLAYGIGNEFKNSLVKMEFNKVSEGNYNVDLYTKNKFSDPVKIIKKSDSNYYILLPETRNEMGRAVQPNTDIKSAGVMSAPYAGQDVNNGYIKIDINTTKPINFNVNVKSVAAAAPITAKKQTEQTAKETVATKTAEKKVQKKNLPTYSSKNVSQKAKRTYKKVAKKTVTPKKVNIPKVNIEQEIFELTNDSIDDIKDLPALPLELANENLPAQEDVSKLKPVKKDKEVKKESSNNIAKGFINFLMLCLAALVTVIVVLLAIRSQKSGQIKLKSKANLLGIEFEKAKNKIKETAKNVQGGNFFVFDKGVKQNALMEPASEIQEPSAPVEIKAESEIIHKALKDDVVATPAVAFEEVIAVAQEVEEHKEVQVTSCPIAHPEEMQVVQEVQKAVIQDEPTILSSVEIGTKKGFMCFYYNNKVSLMGYIFDDVFVLYNFKKSRAQRNYEIQYRLSDKIGKESFYIIKVDTIKMLVKVSKTNITREVIL